MFSRMSSTWADLFKAKTTIIENSNPQCLHEISNDWICVDDQQNCENVNDLGRHEFLSEDQKERRAQWQKRLQKGRSKQYNSMPSKARFRKNSPNSQTKNAVSGDNNNNNINNNNVQSNTTSNPNSACSQQVQLRAKLRLAVEAAGSSGQDNDSGSVSPSFTAHRTKPSTQKPSRNQRGAGRMPIQQPSQRGMN